MSFLLQVVYVLSVIRPSLELHCALMDDPHVLVNGTCFIWYSKDFLSFDDAKARCFGNQNIGYYGKMAILRDEYDLEAIKSLQQTFGHNNRFSYAYIGLERNNTPCINPKSDGWFWLDDTDRSVPVSWWDLNSNESCAHEAGAVSETGLLSLEANIKRTYICSFEEPPTLNHSIACPAGTKRLNDVCLHLHNQNLTFYEARDICSNGSLGFYGDLIMPKTRTDAEIQAQFLQSNGRTGFAWVGIRRRKNRCDISRMDEGGLFFDDDTPFDPTTHPANLTSNNNSCKYPMYYKNDLKKYPGACAGSVSTLGNICYIKSSVQLSLWNARLACRDGRHGFKGFMAMPKTEQQRQAIFLAGDQAPMPGNAMIGIRFTMNKCNDGSESMHLLTGGLIDIISTGLGTMGRSVYCGRTNPVLTINADLKRTTSPYDIRGTVCQYEPGCQAPSEESDYFIPAAHKSRYTEVKGDWEGLNCRLGVDVPVAVKAQCFIKCSEHRLCHGLTHFKSGLCRLHWAAPLHKCLMRGTNVEATMYQRN